MISEEDVLKKLKIADFKHITKDKVIQMTSMLDKMEPEIVKKVIEQIPDFSNTIKKILNEYNELLDKGLKSNNESIKDVYDAYKKVITSLQKELENENLTFEQKKYIIEKMKEIVENMDKKDTENKWFISKIVTCATILVIAIAASLLGGNTKIETDDIYKGKHF
ncbi:MAG: hypothetical protein ACI3ZR_01530 [bacterium]